MIVAYIDEHRDKLGVDPICRVLTDAETKIAPSTYYAAKTRPRSARSVSDAATTMLIGKLHADNYGGSPTPASSRPSARPGTATTTRSPRRSTRCSRPSSSATRTRGAASTTSRSLAEYIDWFSHRRLHGEIGLVPPAEYEIDHYRRQHAPAVADASVQSLH